MSDIDGVIFRIWFDGELDVILRLVQVDILVDLELFRKLNQIRLRAASDFVFWYLKSFQLFVLISAIKSEDKGRIRERTFYHNRLFLFIIRHLLP